MAHLAQTNRGAQPIWETAPRHLDLLHREVHIWRTQLSAEKSRSTGLWPLLSEDEKSRSSQFHWPEDAGCYVISHAMLRDTLARYHNYVDVPLRMAYEPKGRPYLLQRSAGPHLQFSLSHSRSLALLAVTLNRRIGVDLEHSSSGAGWRSLATRYFSPPEVQFLFTVSEPEQQSTFLSLWTHKEAYLKARGEGLTTELSAFTMRESPGGGFSLLDEREAAAGAEWRFLKLTPDEQHVAALAVPEEIGNVQFWEWTPDFALTV